MNTPSPKDMPNRKLVEAPTPKDDSELQLAAKPVFVRKPHLTDRPLKNDPRLQNLKTQLLVDETTQAFKNVGRSARKAGKSFQGLTIASKSNRQFPNNKK